jgi:putative addiction module component (TIGR02574 family)
MPDPVAELAEQGRNLSPEDRVRLLDLLLESLQPTSAPLSDEAWAQEIERRVAMHERGEGVLHELDDVMAEARRIAP